MKTYELPAANKIAKSNNIEISKLLTEENDHEEELEMIKAPSNIINEGDEFDSEFLLEESNFNEWVSETKRSLFNNIENEQGIELVRERKNKDKAYNCKEIDDLNDMNNDVENSRVKPENSNTKVSERFSKPDPETVLKLNTLSGSSRFNGLSVFISHLSSSSSSGVVRKSNTLMVLSFESSISLQL